MHNGRVHPILETVRLEGERVLLRPHAEADAEPAFALLHERQPILRWLLWSGPREVGELATHFRAWRVGTDVADDYHMALCALPGEELVGSLSLRSIGHPGTVDLGYWIGEAFWNRGYASEGVRLAARLAFRHLGAQALTSWVFEGNDASRRVLEKNGFRYVRTAWRELAQGGRRAEWSLALLKEEWEERSRGWRPAREEVGLRPDPEAARGARRARAGGGRE